MKKVEVLVSTMHKKDFSLIEEMNLRTNVLIINQCDKIETEHAKKEDFQVCKISTTERGLAKSRNMALNNAKGDICIIADDDIEYFDNYKDIVLEAYEKYPDTSIIAFEIPSTDYNRPTSTLAEGKIDFLHTLKVSSFQITFKREDIINHNIKFNEMFGAGADYTCGEEHIFLAQALKKGLKVKFRKKEIGIVNHNESTWYNGFDKNLFNTKGAMFYEMSPFLSYLLIVQFAVRKRNLYKNEIKTLNAFKYMIEGLDQYKKRI